MNWTLRLLTVLFCGFALVPVAVAQQKGVDSPPQSRAVRDSAKHANNEQFDKDKDLDKDKGKECHKDHLGRLHCPHPHPASP